MCRYSEIILLDFVPYQTWVLDICIAYGVCKESDVMRWILPTVERCHDDSHAQVFVTHFYKQIVQELMPQKLLTWHTVSYTWCPWQILGNASSSHRALGQGVREKRCYNCNGKGHIARVCTPGGHWPRKGLWGCAALKTPFSRLSCRSQGSHFKQESVHKTPFWENLEISASTASIFTQILAHKPPNSEIFSSQAPKFGNFQLTSPQIWKFSAHKPPFSEANVSSQAPHFGNPGRTPVPEKKLSAPPPGVCTTFSYPYHAHGPDHRRIDDHQSIDKIKRKCAELEERSG